MKRWLILQFVFAVLGTTILSAPVEAYPVKPVRMIVPLAAGGPVDTVARLIGNELSKQLGQQVVIDNRPGAGGSVGGEMVARAAPDGYTLFMAANGTLAIAPHLMKLPYDVNRDLAPISLVGTSPQVLVVHPSLPARSVSELVTLAKTRPGAINFASSGQGSTSHLASELLNMNAKVDIVHVPYRGAGPALADLMAGETQMMITGISSALPYIHSGKLRALGVTGAKRVATLPDTPAIAEVLPGYEVTTWYGVLTTAGTPSALVTQLNREIARALNTADLKTKMANAGIDTRASSPEAFAAMIREETAKWGKLIAAIRMPRQ